MKYLSKQIYVSCLPFLLLMVIFLFIVVDFFLFISLRITIKINISRHISETENPLIVIK